MSSARFSADGTFWVLGSTDGRVRVTPIPKPAAGAAATAFTLPPADTPAWEGRIHDCESGRVTAAVTSFDHKYLLSAGSDGSFLNYLVALDEFEPHEGESLPLPTMNEDETPLVSKAGEGRALLRDGHRLDCGQASQSSPAPSSPPPPLTATPPGCHRPRTSPTRATTPSRSPSRRPSTTTCWRRPRPRSLP